jgi:hypothetical protein
MVASRRTRSSLAISILAIATAAPILPSADRDPPGPRPSSRPAADDDAVTLLFFIPLIGEPTVTRAIKDMTEKIKEDGGTNVRLVATDGAIFWFLLPPITFIIHPAITYCSADAEFAGTTGAAPKAGAGAAAGKKDSKKAAKPIDRAPRRARGGPRLACLAPARSPQCRSNF